jgi:hypothetical protein
MSSAGRERKASFRGAGSGSDAACEMGCIVRLPFLFLTEDFRACLQEHRLELSDGDGNNCSVTDST